MVLSHLKRKCTEQSLQGYLVLISSLRLSYECCAEIELLILSNELAK